MWINNKFMTETEIQAYIAKLESELNERKAQLIGTLEAALTCKGISEDTSNCVDCLYFYIKKAGDSCPSCINQYAAKLLLEELLDKPHINIC